MKHKVLILGGDGYLGWPTAMYLAKKGYEVSLIDSFSKRQLEFEVGVQPLSKIFTLKERVEKWNKIFKKNKISFYIGDMLNHKFLYRVIQMEKPKSIVHYAEQPSAPYSMGSREKCFFTQQNNVMGNVNLLFAIRKYVPNAHLIKLGTMGEYGTPNLDLEEGWMNITYKGRKERILFPKKPGSFYHLSKVHDSHNIEFCCRIWGLRSTDLNQGVVYGVNTNETILDEKFNTSFHYDDIFGTVINRFIAQSVMNENLTIYGRGDQIRTFLNINDTIKCIELSIKNPPKKSEYRVFNQFTEKFSINQIAKKVVSIANKKGYKIKINKINNPRIEDPKHYYNPINKSLLKLGLKPQLLNEKFLSEFIDYVAKYKNNIDKTLFKPRIRWDKDIVKFKN